ncbi:DNA-damage-inducible protein (plasmid) [Calothrix sp. NIES-4071]|nr:DNA-damage-inducible protein [Calothrix sp. NIES-4071]BAZ65032.1 DNA-damage-inducible protein [Calothrix sp. NIES-4105]
MNSDGHELELSSARSESSFYTRCQDGVSGMNVTALSQFCGVDQPVMTELLNKLRDSSTLGNNLPASLKPFAGIEQRIIGNQGEKSLYVKDELCHAILEYYALDARKYKGKQIARDNYRMVAKAGLRVFIWSQTGYMPPSAGALTQQQLDLIELIPKLQETINQLQTQIQNLLPPTKNNTMPPGWDIEVWNSQPPQDKRHFRFLYRRRRFRPSDQGTTEPVVEKIITSEEIKARANQEIHKAIGSVTEEEKERLEAAKKKALLEFEDFEP